MQGTGNRLRRNQNHQNYQCEQELFKRKLKSCKSVTDQCTHGDLEYCDGQGDDQRVSKALAVLHNISSQLVVLCGKVLRNADDDRVIQILLRHEADGDLVQNRLQNKEAHTEQQDKSADADTITQQCFL